MTFRSLIDNVRELVLSAVKNLGYFQEEWAANEGDINVSEAPRKELGDITCNVAFKLSKRIGRSPYDIAKELVEKQLGPYIKEYARDQKFQSTWPGAEMLVSAEAHPAGYINFRVNFAALAISTLTKIITNSGYGFADIGKGKHVILEHTSVNPNKALHVGHLRNVILGDTIYRMLKATNHKVSVLNYIDDSGLQVADIVVGFIFAGFPMEPKVDRSHSAMKFDQYCGDEIYTKINKMYEMDPSLQEKRKCVLKEIEETKSTIAKFAGHITKLVLTEQLKTCWRIKARYDLLNFESHIVSSGLWSNTLDLLKNRGLIIKEREGKNKDCWIIRLGNGNTDLDNNLEEPEKVIVRSDGTSTYIAKDIPYAAWKTGLVDDPFSYSKFGEQWDGSVLWSTKLHNPIHNRSEPHDFQSRDMTITIIDSRQSRLQKIVSRILFYLRSGISNDSTNIKEDFTRNYFHLGYEAVTLNSQTAKMLGLDLGGREFIHMSGRRGINVNADFVLDKLHEKAYDEVMKRNPRLADESINEIAEKIAVSSIRFYMIKHDLNKIIPFDIVESLSLEGETGPYLQYSYARSQRLIEKSGQDFRSFGKANFVLLRTSYEEDLIKLLSKLDLIVEEAVVNLNPKALARYAYELATLFNLYYEKIPILKEKHTETRLSRLILVSAFSIVLNKVLDLLGIDALHKM
ncbi:MAG: arginine--tRNA ligase [Thermoproteota archaeon]|nr:arginine--tRNA ligase [Thermoproteota archaeon]